MPRTALVLIVLFTLVVPATAAADDGGGNGPYAPFPTRVSDSHAARFYGELGADVSAPQIFRGTFVADLRPPARAGWPSSRAGIQDGGTGLPALLAGIVLAGLGALAAASIVLRRPAGRV